MRITQEADYALRICYMLSGSDGVVDSLRISAAVGVTERFTVKILRKLMEGGIVKSKKGIKGGYELAASPSKISIKQVIEMIDGPLMISKCLDGDYECTRMKNERSSCAFHLIFAKLNKRMADSLDAVTFDKLTDEGLDMKSLLSVL